MAPKRVATNGMGRDRRSGGAWHGAAGPLGLLAVLAVLAVMAGGAGAQASLPRSFFAVHCEPHTASPALWNSLTVLVGEAEKRRVRLTLEFTPQWVDLILADPAKLAALRAWEGRGHEVAAHHHDVDHPIWDGYTNTDPRQVRKPGYRGTMADFKRHVDRLVAPRTIRTGGLGTEEWPYGVPFRTQGDRRVPSARSRPTFLVVNEYGVWRLGYVFVPDQATAQQVKALHAAAARDDVIGVVTHVHDYRRAPHVFHGWFDYLAARDPPGTRNVTPAQVLGPLPRPLAADRTSLSVATGGEVKFTLSTNATLAGHTYLLLVTLSGTAPGFNVGGDYAGNVHVGLNPDAVTYGAILAANSPLFPGFLGTLSTAGGGAARFSSRGPLPAGLVGQQADFVFVAFAGGALTYSSDPVAVKFVP